MSPAYVSFGYACMGMVIVTFGVMVLEAVCRWKHRYPWGEWPAVGSFGWLTLVGYIVGRSIFGTTYAWFGIPLVLAVVVASAAAQITVEGWLARRRRGRG